MSRIAPLVFVAAFAACGQPFRADDPLLTHDARERFRSIETMRLADRSRTPPIDPADAVETTPAMLLDRGPEAVSADLSLADVRAAVLANNLDLVVQRIDPRAARAVLDEERAKFEAVFFTDVSGRRDEVPPTALGAESETNTGSLEPGVRIPLRGGGVAEVGLPLDVSRVDPGGLPEADLADAALRFSFSQPLLRNAGVGVNTASIQIARFATRQEEARTKLLAIRVIANAEKAYWTHYAATREVEIRHDQYRWAVEQLDQARRLAAGGAVPDVEILRAQAGVARRLEAIIVAETRRRLAETQLKRFLNRPDLPLESRTFLVPRSEPAPRGLDLDGTALANAGVANRMEMLELEVQLAIDAISVEVARNDTLPVFALDFSYSFKGADPNLADAVGRIFEGDLNDWRVGATLEIPLGNKAARARLRQAVLARARTLATKQQRALSIREEVRNALDQLQQDWQRVLAARRETILAGRNYEAEKRQFQAGVRTSTEVLETAAFLADARSREIQALADYEISTIDLAFATGTVLGHGRIGWDEFGR